jgi:hypothetical protein
MRKQYWQHIVPVGDLREHDCEGECWCQPHYDEINQVVVHQSMDMREYLDMVERVIH